MQGSLSQGIEDTVELLQPLLTIPVVAKILVVSRPTVYALIDTEGLPIIRFGRSVRISPISLQKWLTQHEQEQGASHGR